MNNIRQNIDVKNTLQTTVYITPQMKQSLAILQMPLQELSQEMSNILEENPVLEVIENDGDDFSDDINNDFDNEFSDDNDKSDMIETISSDDWKEYIGYEKSDDISYRHLSDNEGFNYEQFVSSTNTLYEHLIKQLKVLGLNEEELKIGEHIIGNLSDDGYFRLDIDECCEELNVDAETFEYVLSLIQKFDPAGIASQTLQECIITQMIDAGCEKVYAEFAEEILSKYSSELSSYKYDVILKNMSIERDTFDYILLLIKKTDPRPGLNFSGSETKFITPDVFIVPNGEKFDIILNEAGLPPVRLNSYYAKMLNNTTIDGDSKQYIKDKVKNALWVIESLQKRQKAIYKVVKAIADFQGDFLKHGITKLKALKLKDIADVTELHESTVSRVTSGKYAMTNHGLIELKSFFAKSVVSEDGDMSTNVVKTKIKELIDNESLDDVLSDQKIVELMDSKGIKIARRTVAKYREEMNIPTMSQRKRLRR